MVAEPDPPHTEQSDEVANGWGDNSMVVKEDAVFLGEESLVCDDGARGDGVRVADD